VSRSSNLGTRWWNFYGLHVLHYVISCTMVDFHSNSLYHGK